MSTQIDERVVEMRFKNKKFESNVKESLNSIEKLKKSLDFKNSGDSVKSLEDAFNHFSLDSIGSAVDKISEKFSAFGIIGVTALQNITNRAIDAGINLTKSLSIDQITAGWDKYAEKTTAVQTIVSATGESMAVINDQLQKLNWFTDETSYEFNSMVQNIGMFTSAGVSLEDAVTAMIGIANWAAVSGQNAQTASRAMYQLSQAMGSGVIKATDWMSIQTASMSTMEFKNTALETAVALGKLQKAEEGVYKTLDGKATITAENFYGTLQEGWFTTDILTEALKEYGSTTEEIYQIVQDTGLLTSEVLEEYGDQLDGLGLKAFKAGQEAKTFADAIGSVKDAVSSGWMNTFELIFGDYDKARKTWTNLANDLWDVFASGVNDRVDRWKDAGYAEAIWDWDTLTKKINDAGVSTSRFKKAMRDVAMEDMLPIKSWIKEYGSLEATAEKGWMTADRVSRAIRSLIDGGTGDSKTVGTLKDINALCYDIWHNGRENGWKKEVADLGYDTDKFEDLLIFYDQVFKQRGYAIDALTEEDVVKWYGAIPEAIKGATELTDDQTAALEALAKQAAETGEKYESLVSKYYRQSAFDSFVEGAGNIIKSMASVVYTVRDAFQNMFPPITRTALMDVAEGFRDATKSMLDFLDNNDTFYYAVTGLLTPLKVIVVILKSAFRILSPIGKLLGVAATGVLKLLSAFGRLGEKINEETNGFAFITDAISKFVELLNAGVDLLINFSKSVYELVKPAVLGKLNEHLAGIKEKTSGLFNLDKITGYIERINNIDVDKYASKFVNFLKAVKNSETPLKTAAELIGNKLNAHFPKLGGFIESAKNKLVEFWNTIRNFKIGGTSELPITLGDGFTYLKTKASEALEAIKEKFDGAKSIGEKFQEVLGWIKDKFDSISEFISGKFTKSIKEVETATGNVSNGKEGIFSKLFGDGNWKKTIATGGVLALVGTQLVGFFKLISGLSKLGNLTGGGIIQNIKDWIVGIADAIKGKGEEIKRFDWLGFSIGIGLLAGSLVALTTLADQKEIATAAAAMLVTIASVIGTIIAINAMTKKNKSLGKSLRQTGIGLAGAAAALLMFVKAINNLAEMDLSITKVLKIFAGLLVAVGTFKAIAKAGKDFKFTNGLGMVASASALLVFAHVLKKFAKLSFNVNQVFNIIVSLALCLGAIAAINWTSKLSEGNFKMSNGLALVGAATALLMMAKVLQKFEEIHFNSFWDYAGTIFLLGVSVNALIMVANSLKAQSKKLGGSILRMSSAVALIGVATALLLMAKVLEKFNGLDLGKSVISLMVLALCINALDKIINSMSKMTIKGGIGSILSIIGISAFLLIFTENMILLSKVLDWKMVGAFGILEASMIGLGFTLKLIGGMNPKSGIQSLISLIGIGALLAELCVSLIAIKNYGVGFKEVGVVLLALYGAIGALAAVCGVAKLLALTGGIIPALIVIGAILGTIAGLGWVFIPAINRLKELEALDSESAMRGIEALKSLLLSLTAFKLVDIPSIIESLIAIAGLGKHLGDVTEALAELNGLNNESATAGIYAIKSLIEMLKGLANDIKEGAVEVSDAISAGEVLKTFGEGLKPVVTAAAGIDDLDPISHAGGLIAINSLIDLLQTTAAKFTKGDVNVTDATSAGKSLQIFGEGLRPIVDVAAIIDGLDPISHAGGLLAVNSLIDLLQVTAAKFQNNEIDYVSAQEASESMRVFGEGLTPIVNAAVSLASIDTGSAIDAIPAIQGIVDILEGMAITFAASKDLYKGANQASYSVKSFGASLGPIVTAITDLSTSNPETAASAIESIKGLVDKLIEIAEKFSADEGLFTAAKDVSEACRTFSYSLVGFAFAEFVASKADAEKATESMAVINEMVGLLYKTATDLCKDEKIYNRADTIAQTCKKFATAMLGFASSEFILGLSNAEQANSGFNVVSSMINTLTGLATTFSTNQGLFTAATSASEACISFAKAIKKLAKTENRLTKVEADSVNDSLVPIQSMINMLIQLATSFTQNGFTVAANKAVSSFESFGTLVENLLDSLDSVGNGDLSEVAPAIEAITEAMTALFGIDGIGNDNFVKAMSDLALVPWASIKAGLTTLSDGVKELNKVGVKFSTRTEELKTFSEAINSLNTAGQTIESSMSSILTSLTTLGNNMGTALCEGLEKTGTSRGRSAAMTVGNAIVSAINSYVRAMESAGRNMSYGLANGITQASYAVSNAATSVANLAATATRAAVRERSPSKVFMEIGEYMSLGLANGIIKEGKSVEDATAEIANNALSIAYSIADALADDLDEDDLNPVITPVLDLSRVQRDSWRLGAMLPSGSIRLSSQVAASSAKIQNERFAESPIDNVVNPNVAAVPVEAPTPAVIVKFEGSLSQLGAVLQPVISYETNRLGPSLVKG